MPIYEYICPGCHEVEESIVSIEGRDAIKHSCGATMVRVLTTPQKPIIKKTGNDMATETMNKYPNKYNKYVAEGLEEHKTVIGRGFG